MSITTASGERFESLEHFLGDNPNEYVDRAFNAMNPIPIPRPKPVVPITDPNVDVGDTAKHDWEATEMFRFGDNSLQPKLSSESNESYMRMYKDMIERDRRNRLIQDILMIPPKNEGKKVIPGEEDWTRTKDLGKPVVVN